MAGCAQRISSALIICLGALPNVVSAQEISKLSEPPCQVLAVAANSDSQAAVDTGSKWLLASCGKARALIGPVEAYSSSYSAALGVLLVSVEQSGRSRVLLAMPSDGDNLRIEDVSRELARSSGRMPDRGLERGVLDVSGFAAAGTVVIAPIKMSGSAAPPDLPMLRNRAAPDSASVATTVDLRKFVAATTQARLQK